MADTDALKARFLQDPRRLLQHLGLAVDEARTNQKHLWVYDGDEREASLKITLQGDHAGAWYRFGTAEKGDCLSLVQKVQPGLSFPEALELAERVYGEAPDQEKPPRPPARRRSSDDTPVVVGKKTYDLVDHHGRLVAQHHRLDFADGGKRMWYSSGGKRGLGQLPDLPDLPKTAGLPLYRICDVVDDPFGSKPVILVEGEKAADALAAVDLLSVGTACGAAVCPAEASLQPLVGHRVFLWPDNDDAGRAHMDAVATGLRAIEVEVYRIDVDGLPEKGDAADFLEGDGDVSEILKQIAAGQTYGSGAPTDNTQDPDRPQIRVSNRLLEEITEEALESLVAANDPPHLYVRDGDLVLVVITENRRAMLLAAAPEHLRGLLARSASYVKYVKSKSGDDTYEVRYVFPPKDVVGDLTTAMHQWVGRRGDWPVPGIVGVTECPVLRDDGSICAEIGYDPPTRLYYHPTPGLQVPPIPDAPTDAQVRAAVSQVTDIIADFPFEDEASRANAVALMLTAVVRPAIDGPVPIALIDAPQAGTGKSLLADIVAFIATGRWAAMVGAPVREEEWAKKITSLLAGGATVIAFDNLGEMLASHSLAMALTATTVSDRLLGLSRQVELPVRATWSATGNNIQLGGDMPRRCYWIRMDAQAHRPWKGREFRIPDLRSHVAQHRGAILGALLTMARAWHCAGQPQWGGSVIGSFEAWCKLIGGVLQHVGFEQRFLANLEELYDRASDDTEAWEAFLRAWHERWGEQPVTTQELAEATDYSAQAYDPDLTELLPPELLDRTGEMNKKRVGRLLRKYEGVRFGEDGIHLDDGGRDLHSKVRKWRIVIDAIPMAKRQQSEQAAIEDEDLWGDPLG
ncbi:MAG: hypothetical protein GF320_14240 [Armatimonadia bacterium]|nr:hypothetical protein [Armatimonadia bacterium]